MKEKNNSVEALECDCNSCKMELKCVAHSLSEDMLYFQCNMCKKIKRVSVKDYGDFKYE